MKVKWRSCRRIDGAWNRVVLILALVPVAVGAMGATPEEAVAIDGGATHRRAVELAAGTFLHVVVEQQGIDLEVALVDERGEQVARVDSLNGADGPEELAVIVPEDGKYTVEVHAGDSEAAPGRYVEREIARRRATAADRELAAADRAYYALRDQAYRTPRRVIEELEPVVELWRSRGLYRREADTLVPLCDAYLATGEAAAALAACERSILWYRIFEAPRLLAPALRRAVIAHIRRGELDRAAERSGEALGISRELGDTQGVAVSYQRLGEIHYQTGRLQASLDAFDRALAASDDPTRRAWIAIERARTLLDLRRPEETLEPLRAAVEVLRRHDRTKDTALALEKLAEAALQLGELDRAERDAREAVELLVAHDDRRSRAIVLRTLGTVLRHRGELEGARRAFENALELFESVEDPRSRAMVLTELGHVLLEDGDGEGALACHETAAALLRQIRDRHGEAMSRVRGAEALAALGRFEEAWKRIAPALDLVEALRAETARSDFRLTYFAYRREYTRIALDILMELHARAPDVGWDARALAVNDRSLARELVDAVSRDRAQRAADPALAEEERALERLLRSLVAADPLEPPTAVRRQIDAVIDRLYDVRGKLRQASGDVPVPAPPEVDEARVRRLLGDGDLLLVYALGDAKSYLWSLTNRDRRVTTLGGRERIEPWAREFVIGLQDEGDGEPGRRLWELLLAPVAERLHGRRRLIIVADGALNAMPFAALPMPGEERERYLLEEHEIVMLPSLGTLLVHRRQREESPRKWLAVFADPVFSAADPRLASGGAGSAAPGPEGEVPDALARSLDALHPETLRGGRLERLRGTRDEARAIRELVGEERTRVLTGPEVDRAAVLSALSDHRIVHFATHGLSHPRPELSGLVLSLVDAAGRPRDGFLRTPEIARLDVAAELVVLSACETARGEEMAGEGTLGLAWGFLQAGAARVVASLWKVGDASTARLMTRFYEHLDEEMAPSAALRRAQLALAAEPGTTPWDWAGFIFQGDWQRLGTPRPHDEQLTFETRKEGR